MTNFPPMKNYLLKILDIFIKKYNVKPPFLDVGGGIGYVSLFLSKKNWNGKLIDNSNVAIKKSRILLKNTNVIIENKSAFKEKGTYKTIILFDVLEHIEDDKRLLKSLNKNLEKDGYIIISVPINKKEWRWDDDFYGHYRRYEKREVLTLLTQCGYAPLENYDFSFPFFWIMRRFYTIFRKKQILERKNMTEKSSYSKAWDIKYLGKILSYDFIWWLPLKIQFLFKKTKISQNQVMIAKKIS